MGYSNLVVDWMDERWKMNNQKVQDGSAKDAESRLVADHLDLFQYIFWDWNEKADRLAHEARDKGASWNSFTIKEGSKIEAARACFDGGVNRQED